MHIAILYLTTALLTWVGLAEGAHGARAEQWERAHFERPDAAEARLRDTAIEVYEAAQEVDSPVLTALEVLAVAYEESHLMRYVDEGVCNLSDRSMKLAHARELAHGNCDGGAAFTVWQFWYPPSSRMQGEELLGERPRAARKAVALWTAHPQQWATWQAAKRRAGAWWRAHPFGG